MARSLTVPGARASQADIGIMGDEIVAIGSLGTSAVWNFSTLAIRSSRRDSSMLTLTWMLRSSGTRSVPALVFTGLPVSSWGTAVSRLAPANREDVDLVLENLEEAEAIPADVLAAGVEFRWTTFPEFIEVLEQLPKGINYARLRGSFSASHVCHA